jgi:ATP:ADP antiporter, AAA family
MLRFERTLKLRPGEGRTVWLLLLVSFLTGGAVVFSDTASNALFLSLFGAGSLPLVYITTACCTPIVGLAFTYTQRRWLLNRVLIGFNIGLFLSLLGLVVGLHLSSQADWFVFLTILWFRLYNVLGPLLFWSLASRLLDLRQGKRLFGLISTGESISRTIGYFSTSLLVQFIGVVNLLVIGFCCVGGIVLALSMVGRLAPQQAMPQANPAQVQPRRMPNRYIQLIWLVGALASFTYALVEYIFSAAARNQVPTATELAALLGIFFGVLNAFRLLVRPFSGQIIGRFGLGFTLLTLPVVSLLGSVAILAVGSSALAFWAAAFARFSDGVTRAAIYRPAVQVLYQPLRPEQRIATQAVLETVLDPLMMGFSGLLLLVLAAYGFIATGTLLLLVCLAWVVGTVLLNRNYLATLRIALSRRVLAGASLELHDPASVRAVQAALQSPRPSEVLYGLELLAQNRPDLLSESVPPLLANPDPAVRQAAIKLIGSQRLPVDPLLLQQAIAQEPDPVTRGDAARALCALAEDEAVDAVAPLLADPEAEVRTAAMAGLLRHGGVAGVLAAGPALLSQLNAAEPAARVAAARVLARVAAPTFARNLAPLLDDPLPAVRQAALLAAGRINSTRLWPAVIAALADPATYRAASAALVAGGDAVLPALVQAWQANPSAEQSARLAYCCGRIGGPGAISLLLPHLNAQHPELRRNVLAALERVGYGASGAERSLVRETISAEGQRAAWLLAAKADLALPVMAPLSRAIDLELLRGRERLLDLLSLVYDREAIRLARQSLALALAEKRAFALELIDTQVERDLRGLVVALLDELSDALRREQLQSFFPQQPIAAASRLQQLLAAEAQLSTWTNRCVRYTIAVAQGAQTDAASVQNNTALVERTMLLRQVSIFDAMPDDLLVDVADSLAELELPPGTLFIQQGEVGDCMYLVVEGEIEVHDRATVLNRLHGGSVLGELALLDRAPRVASATARTAARLFRLDQQRFSEIIDEHPALARALLRVLARRLRASVRDLAVARAQLQALEGAARAV